MRASRELRSKASWMLLRPTSRFPVRNSRPTRPSIWTSWNAWASFNATATAYLLRLSEQEVKVLLQGRLAIDAAEGISDPKRGWICDLFDSMIERGLPNLSRTNNCAENLTGQPPRTGPTKKVTGFRFLCCCQQVVPFRTNGIGY